MTEFDAAAYFFLTMLAALLLCVVIDWWLLRYDRRDQRVHNALERVTGDRRELLDLFDQERDDERIRSDLGPAASGVHVSRREQA